MRFSAVATVFTSLLAVTTAFPVQHQTRALVPGQADGKPGRWELMMALKNQHSAAEDALDLREKSGEKTDAEEDRIDKEYHRNMWNVIRHGQVNPAGVAARDLTKRGGGPGVTTVPSGQAPNAGLMAGLRNRLPNWKLPTWSGIKAKFVPSKGTTTSKVSSESQISGGSSKISGSGSKAQAPSKGPVKWVQDKWTAHKTNQQIKADGKLAQQMQNTNKANNARILKQEHSIAEAKTKLAFETNTKKADKLAVNIGKQEAQLAKEKGNLNANPFHPVQGTRMERLKATVDPVVQKVKGVLPSWGKSKPTDPKANIDPKTEKLLPVAMHNKKPSTFSDDNLFA